MGLKNPDNKNTSSESVIFPKSKIPPFHDVDDERPAPHTRPSLEQEGRKEVMKHDKALWLLSSAAPVVVAFGFSLASSTVRPSIATIGTPPSSSWGEPGTRRFMMFGGSGGGGGGGGNPLDMVTGMFSPKSSVESAQRVNEGLAALSLVDWETIRSQLESKMTTDEERHFRANLDKGYGVASPLHKVRLFDKSKDEKDIRVTFYRDSASWCPYCQKVWLTLEEKKIPYRVEKINMRCYGEKPDSFKRLQPGGQIPVATIDGTTLRQSNDILYALEESFPEHKSMMPSDSLRGYAQEMLRLEREFFSAWMSWLTQGGGASSKSNFVATLTKVEEALKVANDGPFFLGKDISIVDVQFAPFLERTVASLLYYKGFQIRVAPGEKTLYPAINQWFDAMEQLPSYQVTKSDYYTHCWDLPPQLGGCVSEPAGKPFEAAINGMESCWELPLEPHNGGIEPDWEWAGDDSTAKREAVERLSANHKAIVSFAARGAGSKGFPRYGAPLSDPNATPNKDVQPAVDHMIRLVCLALLGGTESHAQDLEDAVDVIVSLGKGGGGGGGNDVAGAVVASLAYLRDRVGVPRDMKLPAARQLRAHLNWAIGRLSKNRV